MRPLLTVQEIANLLRVSTGWVYDHAGGRRRPHLPSVTLGKLTRFREEDVADWIEAMSRRRTA